jgi:osmoprotectant transport system substrate-binding protein
MKLNPFAPYTLAVVCMLFLPACGGLFPKSIKVGSKNTTEQMILGEIVAQYLDKKTGMKVERRLGIGDAAILHQAAISRDVDVFPEDTATAISEILKENVIMDTTSLWERVRNEYDRLYSMQVGRSIGATSGAVIVVPKALADKERLTDLSSAVESKVGWKLGITEDFGRRKDGMAALSTAYRLTQRDAPKTLDPDNLYRTLNDGQINMISALETDGLLGESGYKVLLDDKRVFPPTEICLIHRRDAAQNVKSLEGALSQLTGRIKTEDLRALAREAIVGKRPHSDIARDFLARAGLN